MQTQSSIGSQSRVHYLCDESLSTLAKGTFAIILRNPLERTVRLAKIDPGFAYAIEELSLRGYIGRIDNEGIELTPTIAAGPTRSAWAVA